MIVHCRLVAPAISATLDDLQLRDAIRRAIDAAREYGLTKRGPTRTYIEMCILFGSAFASDPQYSWLGKILDPAKPLPQMNQAKRLYRKASHYLRFVAGPDDNYARDALMRLSVAAQRSTLFQQQRGSRFSVSMLREAEAVYPEKVAYIGNAAVERLFQQADTNAENLGLKTVDARALFCTLEFSFGHGCADDPFLPWIRRTLEDRRIVDEKGLTDRLKKKSIVWLNHVISSLDTNKPRQ